MDEQPSESQLQTALARAVADARVLALLFILLGVLGCGLSLMSLRRIEMRAFGAGCAVMLLAPGVLYFFAGRQIHARQSAGGRLGLVAGAIHLGAIPLALAVGLIVHGEVFKPLIVPAIISTFFVPALIALLFSMRKAERIARLLGESRQGFAVLPVVKADERSPG